MAAKLERTETPGVFRRGSAYAVIWQEDHRQRQRAFPTYAAACAFRRDFVIPYRRRARDAIPPTSLTPPPSSKPGWVYFFRQRGTTAVKIGWSLDVEARRRALSTGSPRALDLVALIPGPQALERYLHKFFAERRIVADKEWFSVEVLDDLTTLLGRAKQGWLWGA